eukprot:gene32456-31068_t
MGILGGPRREGGAHPHIPLVGCQGDLWTVWARPQHCGTVDGFAERGRGHRVPVFAPILASISSEAAKAGAGGSFWLCALMLQSVLHIPSPAPMALAIVQYGDDMGPIMNELPNSWEDNVTLEDVEQKFTFNIDQTQVDDKGISWAFFNNISMTLDDTHSVLNQSLTNTLGPNENFAPFWMWWRWMRGMWCN